MANGVNGGGNGSKLSDKTWISVGLLVTLLGFVAGAVAHGTAMSKDIEHAQDQIRELRSERDAVRDKLSNYRAEVEGFRTQCYEVNNDLEHFRERLAVMETTR